MIGHISTPDTFFIDPIKSKEKSECPVCCQMAHSEMGYTGKRWLCCKIELCGEDFMGSIVKKRREKILKLNRKEMGKLTGYSPKTIKQYEWVKCSKQYFDKTTKFMKEMK